jgi:hypothetical protein
MGVSRPLGYMMLGAAGAIVTERVPAVGGGGSRR